MKCGNCKSDHETVEAVKVCYGLVTDLPAFTPAQVQAANAGYAEALADPAAAFAQDFPELAPAPAPAKPEGIPAGRYALADPDDGTVKFYKVDRPTEGKWKGYTFTKLLVGAPGDWSEYRLAVGVRMLVEHAIAADPLAAAELFGLKAKACSNCGAWLSNVRSRAALVGEKCASNLGRYYPSEAEAREILHERGESVED